MPASGVAMVLVYARFVRTVWRERTQNEAQAWVCREASETPVLNRIRICDEL